MNQRVLKNLRKERNKSGHDTLRSKISQKQDGCNIYICIYIYIYIHNIHIYIYIHIYVIMKTMCTTCLPSIAWLVEHFLVIDTSNMEPYIMCSRAWLGTKQTWWKHIFFMTICYIYICVCVYIYKFISLSIYLSIFLSIHLPICLYNIYRFLWVLDVCRLPSTFYIPVF